MINSNEYLQNRCSTIKGFNSFNVDVQSMEEIAIFSWKIGTVSPPKQVQRPNTYPYYDIANVSIFRRYVRIDDRFQVWFPRVLKIKEDAKQSSSAHLYW